MSGRFQDVWEYVWPEIWLPLEQSDIWAELAESSGYSPGDLYLDIYVEFVKALKKAPQPEIYDATANDAVLARHALETTPATALRCEAATARFFENAFEAISEAGSSELENEYRELVRRFLATRNLRYELLTPFKLHSHVAGIFAALFSDVLAATDRSEQLRMALGDFEHAFRALERSHSEGDMKTCILKATMLTEALASAVPGARGQTLADLCNSIECWPHSAIKEAVKRLYGFCSDYPGIRHNISSNGVIRSLEVRDSVIVPLLLVTAAGYFGQNSNLLDALRIQSVEPPQEPADLPAIAEAAANVSLP
jgi:hypothetical protein